MITELDKWMDIEEMDPDKLLEVMDEIEFLEKQLKNLQNKPNSK